MPAKFPVNPDLSLVSIDLLMEEIFKRCTSCLIVTSTIEDPGAPIVRVSYDGGAIVGLGLAVIAEYRMRSLIGEFEDE